MLNSYWLLHSNQLFNTQTDLILCIHTCTLPTNFWVYPWVWSSIYRAGDTRVNHSVFTNHQSSWSSQWFILSSSQYSLGLWPRQPSWEVYPSRLRSTTSLKPWAGTVAATTDTPATTTTTPATTTTTGQHHTPAGDPPDSPTCWALPSSDWRQWVEVQHLLGLLDNSLVLEQPRRQPSHQGLLVNKS